CNLAMSSAIAEHDAVYLIPSRQRLLVAKVIAFHVADGNAQHLALRAGTRERRVGALHAHVHKFADVFQPGIAHERAGKQAGFAENLEAIADAEHQASGGSELLHRVHYRRELGDSAGSQVIAISEAAGNNDGIAVLQVVALVPQERDRLLR